jgi:hypothetical protein
MSTIKKYAVSAIAAISVVSAFANGVTKSKSEDVAKKIPQETQEQYNKRISWWINDRFGMFIHFGLYAAPARHEWMKKYEKLSNEEYEKYFENFNPDLLMRKSGQEARRKQV